MRKNHLSNAPAETVARKLTQDLHTIGSVHYAPRLHGFAVFEDDVMFAFVESDGTVYLRTSSSSGARFATMGAHKHPEMPYWSVPVAAQADLPLLRELAYEAADTAHLAVSFDIVDIDTARGRRVSPIMHVISWAVVAA